MRRIALPILIIICYLTQSSAQERFKFPNSGDVGLNITNVLSAFIGNTNEQVDAASYPFVAKLNRGANAFRIGLGFNFDNSDETLATVEQFILNNYQLNARVGYERKKYLGNNFGFYFGFDLLLLLQNDESTLSNNIDITHIIENTTGIGGGPVYGFEYYLNKYLYFGAEGSFYGLYKVTNVSQEFTFNPAINSEKVIKSVDAQILPPVSLYVMVRF